MRARPSGCFLLPPGWEHVRPRPVPAGSEPPAQGGALSQDLENAPGAISIVLLKLHEPWPPPRWKSSDPPRLLPRARPVHAPLWTGGDPLPGNLLPGRCSAQGSPLDGPRGAAGDLSHLPHRFRLNPTPAGSPGPPRGARPPPSSQGLAHGGRSARVGSLGKQGLETWRRLVCDEGPEPSPDGRRAS